MARFSRAAYIEIKFDAMIHLPLNHIERRKIVLKHDWQLNGNAITSREREKKKNLEKNEQLLKPNDSILFVRSFAPSIVV